jgi:Right handed beta helix region
MSVAFATLHVGALTTLHASHAGAHPLQNRRTMTKIASLLTLLFTVLICLLPAAPAQATAARTFVSAAGSDSNNCANVLTPCRHLAAAYAATAANGEIYVLDPANYGSLTITGPVSIEGHGWASIAPVTGFPAITINANPGDRINIIGVVLDGTSLSGTAGIAFNSGGSLIVRDSVIRSFSSDGISFGPTASTPSHLFVSNTLLSDNGQNGIGISPSGTGNVSGTLDRAAMENNGGNGLQIQSTSGSLNFTVSDSVSSDNGANGINVSSSDPVVNVMVRNSTIANNANDGLLAGGSGCTGLGSPNTKSLKA